LKEYIRVTLSWSPHQEKTPRLTVHEAVNRMCLTLNYFPSRSGLNVCARTILHGKSTDCDLLCRVPFGDCVQTHEENNPTNNMQDRSLGVMCLGPMDNSRGGHKFMNLNAGEIIERRSFTPIPMMQEVMDRVIELGYH